MAHHRRQQRIDVIISNVGYNLFGAAEELTAQQMTDCLPEMTYSLANR